MMFRNTFRLLLANFVTFWKEYLYKIICIVLTLLLLLPFANTFFSLPTIQSLKPVLKELLVNFPFTDISYYLTQIYIAFDMLLILIKEFFAVTPFGTIYSFFVLFIVSPFFFYLSNIVIGELLYGIMSSLAKYSYTGSYIKKIGKSSVYAIFSAMILIPFTLVFLAGSYFLLQAGVMNETFMIFLPLALLVFVILVFGFKLTLFSGVIPAMTVYNCNYFKGVKRGMRATFRRFFKSFSTLAMILLVYILLVSVFGMFSLLLIAPLLAMSILVFNMVMFFGSQGMRYYVDLDTILSPKKLEETDKIKKAKNII